MVIKNHMKELWEKEEKTLSKELSTALTKELNGKDVKKKIDALNQECNSSKKPTKELLNLYKKELDTRLKAKTRTYSGMDLEGSVSVKSKSKGWQASVDATAEYVTTWRGNVKHTAAATDTFQTIAKKYYGHEMYWEVLVQANQFCFHEGAVIDVPMIEVIKDTYSGKAKPKSGGKTKPAKVLYPEIAYNFDKTKAVTTYHMFPGIPLLVEVKYEFKGEITLKKAGTISSSFNLKSHEAEMTKKAKGLTGKLTLNKFKPTGVGYAVDFLGKKWTAAVSLTKDASAKVEIAPKPVTFKVGGVDIEGKVGISIEIKVYPTKTYKPPPVPQPHPIYEFAEDVLKVVITVELLLTGVGLLPAARGGPVPQPAGGVYSAGPVPYGVYDPNGVI
ncbi:MAG: hypothetical protein AB3N21_06250 [Ruegeria sp.]|uniref:hypothetical protein n=1 Tax=Ruegeria sp. TaxID=1879320 RepID=UPI00349E77E8